MASPFPGMDPYIEACGLWGDFHSHLIERIHEALAGAVPERYVVRTGERTYLVVEEEFRETFVEVRDTERDDRLVTCIEVLSPSNKCPNTPGWDLYQRKRQGLLLGEAHFVEIDLLRGGQRMPMLAPWPAGPYLLMVARARQVPRCLTWPASFRSPLPPIDVPLLRPDPDVTLNLQPLLEAIYVRSRYDRSIDYARPLKPRLRGEEATWVAERLRAAPATASPRARRGRGRHK